MSCFSFASCRCRSSPSQFSRCDTMRKMCAEFEQWGCECERKWTMEHWKVLSYYYCLMRVRHASHPFVFLFAYEICTSRWNLQITRIICAVKAIKLPRHTDKTKIMPKHRTLPQRLRERGQKFRIFVRK